MQTASFIRAIAKEKKLSQECLSSLIGITPSALRRRLYLNSFTIADVEKFCKATGKRLCICDAHTGVVEHIIEDNKQKGDLKVL